MSAQHSDPGDAAAPVEAEVPSAIYVECPECGDETLHQVLKGTLGTRGTYTLDATVQCSECRHTHHVVVREAKDVTVPIVVSHEDQSERKTVELPGDEEVNVDDVLLVDGRNVRITAIELENERRVSRAQPGDVQSLWGKDFDAVRLRFAVNLKRKTASHELVVEPQKEVKVGDEYTFGRLRVVVHAIKVKDRPILREGSAEAGDIVRVFTRPARVGRKAYRPPKDVREQQRRQSRDDSRDRRRSRGRW